MFFVPLKPGDLLFWSNLASKTRRGPTSIPTVSHHLKLRKKKLLLLQIVQLKNQALAREITVLSIVSNLRTRTVSGLNSVVQLRSKLVVSNKFEICWCKIISFRSCICKFQNHPISKKKNRKLKNYERKITMIRRLVILNFRYFYSRSMQAGILINLLRKKSILKSNLLKMMFKHNSGKI